MKCPSCGGVNVFHSHPRSRRDRLLKRALPISFYRCHDCNWRRPKFRVGLKSTLLWAASLVGYVGGITLIAAVIAGLLYLVLTFLGIPISL